MADKPQPASTAPAILLVEDHDVVRMALRDWLRTLFPSWLVLEARSGEEALTLMATRPPQIVVMDLSLPGMGGIEATRRLKQICPSARVVILTIHEEQFYEAEAFAAGAEAFEFKRDMQTGLLPVLKRWLAPAAPETVGVTTNGAG